VIHQRRDDPLSICVYEKYASNEAFAEHGKNLAAKGAEFMALMDGPPEIILLEEI
jgi:quinol monooxygenase YgiN